MPGRKALSLLLLLVASPVAAQTPAPPAADPGPDIIVTGRRLSDTERALAECLKRNCPPNQDIDATLAHVENLFVAGEYQQARMTSKASLHRNRKHARDYPVPVSDLERSNGRVSAHLGEKFDYQYSTWGIRRALKKGLPASDPRLVGANLEIAQMLAATGRVELAYQTYDQAIRDAEKIDRPDLAAAGRLRRAYLSLLLGDDQGGRKSLEAIAAAADPRARGARLAAMLLLSQDDRKKGKPDRTDELLTELKRAGLKQPVLVFAPAYELRVNELATDDFMRSGLRALPLDTYEKKWIDVGYWVRPDGRVEDVEVLRASGDRKWAEPLLKSVKGRIYSPVVDNDAEGAYRVERYSYTSFWDQATGSRIRQRGTRARVEFLDLTAPSKGGTASR